MISQYDAERTDVLPYVPREITSLLDVGCDTGRFGALLRGERPSADLRLTGVELRSVDSEFAVAYDDLLVGPYPMAIPPGSRFDCIVMNDVLEHIADPWSALEATHSFLSGPRMLVGSLPNIRNAAILKQVAVDGDFRYQETGILDRTHLRFFTRKSLERLLVECGFEVRSIDGSNMPDRTLAHRLVKRFGRTTGRDLIARQLIFVATSNRGADALA